tara:strand:- start:441475 stop:443211 length:1737 start_codon:yes stop_codon:yes gene_type:complete
MRKPPQFTRRSIVKGISAAALMPLLGSNLIGCSDSSDNPAGPEIDSVPADFLHGVASGDPLGDRIILWTRVTPEREGAVQVDWELASDPDFNNLISSGSGVTTAGVDYTVKVDADGLEPATDYYFRFLTGDKISVTGKTRSAPTGALAAASLAVVSCSNYPAGYFHVYRDIANQDVEAVLHLGDYLYEYAIDGYASEQAEALERQVQPPTELLSLADYRIRYAQYRGDTDLQACHAAHPFIIVWDDHEVANDAWREGAENHDPQTEGSFTDRRAAAIQAWYEWLPVRPPADEQEIIYRRFRYGDLIDLLMLDTRIIGRDQQVSYSDFVSGGMIDSAAARAATGDSSRTLLGETQREWLKAALTDSTATWQVLGQQVLMGRQPLPEPIVRALSPEFASENSLNEATAAVLAAVAAKNKPPQDRTPEEQALLDSSIPFNPDAWDGYDFEREEILFHASQVSSRLVALAGDTHNSWASQLTLADGTPVGVEFAAPSVSSPGAEAVIGLDAAALFAPLAVQLMDDLRYANLVNRGYLTVTFSATEVAARWQYVSDITAPDYSVQAELEKNVSVSADTLLLLG